MRQNYTLKELQSIIDAYPHLGEIKKATMFTSGYENSNFLIETESGDFVVKVFESVGVAPETVILEIEIMDRLFKAGIKTPGIFRATDGSLYRMFGDKIAILMSHIEGQNMAKSQLSDLLVADIGEQVGKMDAALQPLRDQSNIRQDYDFDLKNLMNLEPWANELGAEFDKEMILRVFEDFSAIKEQFDKMPSGLIHNDVVLHNILADGDVLKGIVDFSDMVFSPYVQNIAVAMSQMFFSHNWQPKQAAIFLNHYQKFHPISKDELSVLRTLIAARFCLLIVAFNHWNVIYGDDVDRLEFISDNVGFLRRFLEISSDDFYRLVGSL